MADLTKFNNGKPFTVTPTLTPATPEAQFMEAMCKADINPPGSIIGDGTIHRFNTAPGKKNGWYVLYADGVPAGAFGDWSKDVTHSFRADVGRELTPAEEETNRQRMLAIKVLREAELATRHAITSESAYYIWQTTQEAPVDHPYLVRKGVQPHGLHVTGDGRLVVPVYSNDKMTSLQYIAPDGTKSFHNGGEVKGCYWFLGEPTMKGYMAEGFATAASIYEATGVFTIIAFNAGNMAAVAKLFADISITVVADNDASGAGEKGAKATGLPYTLIPIIGEDANDYAQHADLRDLLAPTTERWLINGNEFLKAPQPISWLVKRWLQEQALVMVHGPSGSGKTFVVLDWMLHISTGQPAWMNCKVHQGDVVYLCGEGHHGLRARIAAWAIEHDVTNVGNIYISRGSVDLDNPSVLQEVLDEIRATNLSPKLIVIDTLNRFFAKDENSAKDARDFLAACALLQKTFNCTVLIVHHTGVDPEAQNRARGSSAWKGALDIELGVRPLGDNSFTLNQLKAKDSEALKPISLELKSVAIPGWLDEDGEQVSSAVVVGGGVVAEKKGAQVERDLQLLKDAWWGHEEVQEGTPYISYKTLKNYLLEKRFMTEEAAKKALGDGPYRPIGRLIADNIIEKSGEGWLVIDDLAHTMLMLGRSK